MKFSNILLYINTVKHLRLMQLIYRIKNYVLGIFLSEDMKFQKIESGSLSRNFHIFISELDEDEDYLSRFNVNEILANHITLLHKTEELNGKYVYPNESVLWNYTLQYFEWSIPIAIQYIRTNDNSWIELYKRLFINWTKENSEYTWRPYPVSLRIRNLLISVEIIGTALENEFLCLFYSVIYQQYDYLKSHLEKQLLANHYLENLITLVICSNLFDECKKHEIYCWELLKELKEEILADGMHFELSPMYHKIVLEDLIRVYISERGCSSDFLAKIRQYIIQMTCAMLSLENGFKRTPHFNDSANNIAKTKGQLAGAVRSLIDDVEFNDAEREFKYAGYYKFYDNINGKRISVIYDAGIPGPSYNPGHAHNDCLSFELAIDGIPLFVNCGTATYVGGVLRDFFRSTEAHNTISINGTEQSQCWSRHRVARRGSGRALSVRPNGVDSIIKDYKGNVAKRNLELHGKMIKIREKAIGNNSACMYSYLHISPEFDLVENDGRLDIYMSNQLICNINPIGYTYHIKDVPFSTDFEKIETCKEIVFNSSFGEELNGYNIIFV